MKIDTKHTGTADLAHDIEAFLQMIMRDIENSLMEESQKSVAGRKPILPSLVL